MYSIRLNYLFFFAACLLMQVSACHAQSSQRLKPGVRYQSGEVIYAPHYGFTSMIPPHWNGTLPIEKEIFLLVPDTITIGGEIFVFASDEKELSKLRKHWLKGVALSETIKMKATNIIESNDMISSEIIPEGDAVNTGRKGFAMARCGPFGFCITTLAIGPVQCYGDMKTAVTSFMNAALFDEPSNVSIYVDFNWKEFLSDKSLMSLVAEQGASGTGTKENIFHLCKDGTFTGRIKKKGTMKKSDASYKGNETGTWSTESIGETGLIRLNFKKNAPAEFALSISEDKVYVDGERYFVAQSEECKR
jgi:hypothetical protein